MAGSRPHEYDFSVDSAALYKELPSMSLRSKEGVTTTGFGTVMQKFGAADYWGKSIQFTANVRAQDVKSWSGLWMRVDQGGKVLAFDNMHTRGIRGTTGWKRYSVVLDVPRGATGVFLGILLDGPGVVWMNGPEFGIARKEASLTAIPMNSHNSAPGQAASGEALVRKTDEGMYHIVLPANLRWGAGIPNPGGAEVTIFNVSGRVCWDPHPEVPNGCNGPEGSGRIPSAEMSQPQDFLAPDKAAGALVMKTEGGRTYFSINDRGTAFADNTGQFTFDVKLGNPASK